VLRHVSVLVVVPVHSVVLVLPVVWHVLDPVMIMMVVHMLRVVLPLVSVRIVVSHVVVALRLHIVILTVLFTGEVALVTDVRHVILQVPVALREVGIWVMLVTVHKLSHVRLVVSVLMLVRRLFVASNVTQHVVLL